MKTITVWFSKQGSRGKLLLGGLGLLFVIGICSIIAVILTRPEPQSPLVTATSKGADIVIFITWTPGPATSTPTLNGSVTPANSATPTLSPTATATDAPLPTGLPTLPFETPTTVVLPTLSRATTSALVIITAVDKELEFVDIQNAGSAPASLTGWVLVSETGNQSCKLRGILLSKQVLRIWAGKGQVGISCEFRNPIWLDEESDPAVLYNAIGDEVSRYP